MPLSAHFVGASSSAHSGDGDALLPTPTCRLSPKPTLTDYSQTMVISPRLKSQLYTSAIIFTLNEATIVVVLPASQSMLGQVMTTVHQLAYIQTFGSSLVSCGIIECVWGCYRIVWLCLVSQRMT